MGEIKYAMVVSNVVIRDNSKKQKSLEVVQGEIVKVIQYVGTIAIVRPYNQRSMYAINTNYLNFNIPQDDKCFCVSFGVRRLIV